MIAIFVALIGALNWGLVGAFDFNLVETVLPIRMARIIYVLVGVAGLSLLFQRDMYLPFLGQTALPCHALPNKIPDEANVSVTVKVPANAKVVYWASEHSKEMEVADNPWTAYGQYENSGVVTADKTGDAILKIRDATKYKVPSGKVLEKHVHYRYCQQPGLLSPVFTAYL